MRKILSLNDKLNRRRVEVILLSRNSADTGLRVFNSIEAHNLGITRAAFCGGEAPWRYVSAFGCHLFLSTNAADVSQALNNDIAAASLLPSDSDDAGDELLRIAFDGDNVLFSDDAERGVQAKRAEGILSPTRWRRLTKNFQAVLSNLF